MLGMTCHLYLIVADVNSLPIRDHGFGDKVLFKIGIATNPERRLADIQVSCPFSVSMARAWTLPNQQTARTIEARVHDELARCGLNGEWFFQSIDAALSGVEKIFAEVGYGMRLAEEISWRRRPRARPIDRQKMLESRTAELAAEYGAIVGEETEAVRHAAYLTAIAERMRGDYARRHAIPYQMVERAESEATNAIKALGRGSPRTNLDLKSAQLFLRLSWQVDLSEIRAHV
jgi:Meiotically up-regulated gene 113